VPLTSACPRSAIVAFHLALLVAADSRLGFAQSGCREIRPPTDGWVLDLCTEDPGFGERMTVVLDGLDEGTAKMVRVYHITDDGSRLPQVAVFNASGFVRLKQNADPEPPIPFGSSFVLGPAYWPDETTYHHSPRIDRLEMDSAALPSGPLRLVATGDNHTFSVRWEMSLPPPRDRQTRLHVVQTHTATQAVGIDPVRRGEAQGFKLVQISSMYVNEGAPCDSGDVDCHDSDAARYIGADLHRRDRAFRDVAASGFVFPSPVPLGDTWLDAVHSDDESWQGNTPNVRIALDELPDGHTVTPQGFVTATTDPNDDNVGLWLHDDGPASAAWAAGESGRVAYWLVVQDAPPDPLGDLGLRPGMTFLDFETAFDCRPVVSAATVVASVAPIPGYADTALELVYDLGDLRGDWAQIRCDLSLPLDLSAHDHFRLEWRGDGRAPNSLEIGAIVLVEGEERVFIRSWPSVSHRSWWGRLTLPFDALDREAFDPSRVTSLLVAVKNAVTGDQGGAGRLAIDNVGAWNVAGRSVPDRFEPPPRLPGVAAAAASWLAGQQQPSGLVRSWEQDAECLAHTYTQALALVAFAREDRRNAAAALAHALVTSQNTDGSWAESFRCDGTILNSNRWEGAIAWTVHALSRYLALGGTAAGATEARNRGAAWLSGLLRPDGCPARDHTEGTLDVWWALFTAGPAYAAEASRLEDCLLREYWDPEMGRFKGGRSSWEPFLDNQTWGASFLHATGRSGDALRALSYAWQTLRQPARGGHLVGFDGQAGPWAVWNEGTAQYAAAGGPGAPELTEDLLAHQRPDGGADRRARPLRGQRRLGPPLVRHRPDRLAPLRDDRRAFRVCPRWRRALPRPQPLPDRRRLAGPSGQGRRRPRRAALRRHRLLLVLPGGERRARDQGARRLRRQRTPLGVRRRSDRRRDDDQDPRDAVRPGPDLRKHAGKGLPADPGHRGLRDLPLTSRPTPAGPPPPLPVDAGTRGPAGRPRCSGGEGVPPSSSATRSQIGVRPNPGETHVRSPPVHRPGSAPRSRLALLAAVATAAGAPSAAHAQPWQARHGLTSRRRRTPGRRPPPSTRPLDQLTQEGYRLVQVDGYEVEVLDDRSPAAAPGTTYSYLNFGYCVLGRIVETLGGQPYEAWVRRNVLAPAGITRMEIAGDTLADRKAEEVVYYGGSPYAMPVARMDAHGGWLASPLDLTRLLVRVDGRPAKPNLLSATSRATMLAASPQNSGYAKGWIVDSASQSHNGAFAGTIAFAWIRNDGHSAAVFANTRPVGDEFAFGMRAMDDGLIDDVTTWPTWDMF